MLRNMLGSVKTHVKVELSRSLSHQQYELECYQMPVHHGDRKDLLRFINRVIFCPFRVGVKKH